MRRYVFAVVTLIFHSSLLGTADKGMVADGLCAVCTCA